MIIKQTKQYIYGDLYIIDIYKDGHAGCYVNAWSYWTDENAACLIQYIKRVKEKERQED